MSYSKALQRLGGCTHWEEDFSTAAATANGTNLSRIHSQAPNTEPTTPRQQPPAAAASSSVAEPGLGAVAEPSSVAEPSLVAEPRFVALPDSCSG